MISSPFRLRCAHRPAATAGRQAFTCTACRADFKSDASNSTFMLNPPAGLGQSRLNGDLVERHGLINSGASVSVMLESTRWYRQPRLWNLLRVQLLDLAFPAPVDMETISSAYPSRLPVFMPTNYPAKQFPRQFQPIQAAGRRCEKQQAFLRGGCVANLTATRTA
jgi:hypothetical protein